MLETVAPDAGGERGVRVNTASIAAFDGQTIRLDGTLRRAPC